MNKRMREIITLIQEKTNQAKVETDVTVKCALMDEVDALQKEFDVEKRIYESEKATGSENATTMVEDHAQADKDVKNLDAVAKFGADAKVGFRLNKGLNEGTNADGGYTVPEDVQTKIRNYRDAKSSLLHLVTVENVTTNRGQRTYKKRAQQTGFTKVGEGGSIGAKSTPQFERISYEIDKYAGYFPVTNEVLADSDSNLGNVLVNWIGDESRVTANKLILEQIGNVATTEFTGLDDVKKAFNVTLGSAFKSTSKIVTNDNGLQYLDTLKDSTGRYLLAPMPGDTMKMGLQVGASTIPVEVFPVEDMPNLPYYVATADTSVTADKDYYSKSSTTGLYTKVAEPTGNPKTSGYYEVSANKEAIPFVCGDLKEGIIYWDRQMMNIKISDVAVVGDLNAYEEDLTLYRAIEREDVTLRDTKAIVNGIIAVNK